jgi:hypothetical protein
VIRATGFVAEFVVFIVPRAGLVANHFRGDVAAR